MIDAAGTRYQIQGQEKTPYIDQELEHVINQTIDLLQK
jgi:hypothetical protein